MSEIEDPKDADWLAPIFDAGGGLGDMSDAELAELMTANGDSGLYLRITSEDLVVQQLERCAEHWRAAAEDPMRLLDCVRCAHLALISAMTAALNGSAGVGALRKSSRESVLAWINTGTGRFVEQTMSFPELLAEVQKPDALEWGAPMMLTAEQKDEAAYLDWLRKQIDHPKPTTWSVPIADTRSAILACVELVQPLMERAKHHYDADASQRVGLALAAFGRS